MADDFLNAAVDAVVTALKASLPFMAPAALVNATGVIAAVEDYLPDTTEIPDYSLPHASVVYLGDDILPDLTTGTTTGISVEIGLRLYARGADRRGIWRDLIQAAAAVERTVTADRTLGGAVVTSFYGGGNAIDTQEQSGFGAMQLVKIHLWLNIED